MHHILLHILATRPGSLAGTAEMAQQTNLVGMLPGGDRASSGGGLIVVPEISSGEWARAASCRVLFGHQSVGGNILDGVAALAAQHRAGLKILELTSTAATGPGIYHFPVGQNGDPTGKLRDLRKVIARSGADGCFDVVMVKFCYVDFTDQTVPATLAEHYLTTLQNLQARHSGTRFVAITSPLTSIQRGPKAWIKRAFGRAAPGLEENARRHEFNDYLRSSTLTADLFDLAAVEASEMRPPQLDARLTDDGGHLNELGRRVAGAAFVKFLAGDSTPRGGHVQAQN